MIMNDKLANSKNSYLPINNGWQRAKYLLGVQVNTYKWYFGRKSTAVDWYTAVQTTVILIQSSEVCNCPGQTIVQTCQASRIWRVKVPHFTCTSRTNFPYIFYKFTHFRFSCSPYISLKLRQLQLRFTHFTSSNLAAMIVQCLSDHIKISDLLQKIAVFINLEITKIHVFIDSESWW